MEQGPTEPHISPFWLECYDRAHHHFIEPTVARVRAAMSALRAGCIAVGRAACRLSYRRLGGVIMIVSEFYRLGNRLVSLMSVRCKGGSK